MCSARPSPRPMVSATKIDLFFKTAKLSATFLHITATFLAILAPTAGLDGSPGAFFLLLRVAAS